MVPFLDDDGWRAVERRPISPSIRPPDPGGLARGLAGGAAGPVAMATVAVALTVALLAGQADAADQ
jgi:hypothetical protein